MLHIYRQITALERFRPVVIAQKREEAERFPFEPVYVVRKPATHFLRRLWFRTMRDAPWQMSHREVVQIRRLLEENEAQLLHIYFGHIAVHLLPLILHWRKPTVVSFHGADVMVELDKPHYRAATREMLAAARLVLVRSESLAPRARRAGLPEREDPAATNRHSAGRTFCFGNASWPNDGAWRFLQAGRLIEKKGLVTSLRAFAKFQRRKSGRRDSRSRAKARCRPNFEELARGLGIRGPGPFCRLSFPGATARDFFRVAHFPASERAGRGWKPGRRA